MISYSGKSKCGFNCGRRAKFKAVDDSSKSPHSNLYACHEHRSKIEGMPDPVVDSGYMSEADYQTWGRL